MGISPNQKIHASMVWGFLSLTILLALLVITLTGTWRSASAIAWILIGSAVVSAIVWSACAFTSFCLGRWSKGRTWPRPVNIPDMLFTFGPLVSGLIMWFAILPIGVFTYSLYPSYAITSTAVDRNQRLWIAVSCSRHGRNELGTIRRVAPDGRLTNDFKTEDLGRDGMSAFSFLLHDDGSLTVLVGQPYPGDSSGGYLVRLTADAKVDTGFKKHGLSIVQAVAKPDGHLWFFTQSGLQQSPLVEISKTGEALNQIRLPAADLTSEYHISAMALYQDDILVGISRGGNLDSQLLRLTSGCSWDINFSRRVSSSLSRRPISVKTIRGIYPHARGILLVGRFDTRDTFQTFNLIRLRETGDLDPEFLPFRYPVGGESYYAVGAVAVAADQSILVGGKLSDSYAGRPRGLYRLLPDGQMDLHFSQAWAERLLLNGKREADIRSLSPMLDGRVYVTGGFNNKGGQQEPFLLRLHRDGTWDDTFVSRWNAGLRKRLPGWRGHVTTFLEELRGE